MNYNSESVETSSNLQNFYVMSSVVGDSSAQAERGHDTETTDREAVSNFDFSSQNSPIHDFSSQDSTFTRFSDSVKNSLIGAKTLFKKPPHSNKGGNDSQLSPQRGRFAVQNLDYEELDMDYENFKSENSDVRIEVLIDWLSVTFSSLDFFEYCLDAKEIAAITENIGGHVITEDGKLDPAYLDLFAEAFMSYKRNLWYISANDLLPASVNITELDSPNAKGYNASKFLFPAGRVSAHTEIAGQGLKFEWGGTPLAKLRESGVNVVELLAHLISLGGRVARIDYALDIYNSVADVHDMQLAFLADLVETPAKNDPRIFSSSQKIDGQRIVGSTWYLGSNKSDRFLKVYDKFFEQSTKLHKQLKRKMTDFRTGEVLELVELPDCSSWIRLELTLRGDRAHNSVLAFLDTGVSLARFIPQVIEEYCSVPTLHWFRYALDIASEVFIEPISRAVTNGERWLVDSIMPFMDKLIRGGSQIAVAMCNDLLLAHEQAKSREFYQIGLNPR